MWNLKKEKKKKRKTQKRKTELIDTEDNLVVASVGEWKMGAIGEGGQRA